MDLILVLVKTSKHKTRSGEKESKNESVRAIDRYRGETERERHIKREREREEGKSRRIVKSGAKMGDEFAVPRFFYLDFSLHKTLSQPHHNSQAGLFASKQKNTTCIILFAVS